MTNPPKSFKEKKTFGKYYCRDDDQILFRNMTWLQELCSSLLMLFCCTLYLVMRHEHNLSMSSCEISLG